MPLSLTQADHIASFYCFSHGAVKRLKQDRTEHTISYEAFVEELDAGDSFTTSLVELLVKVYAPPAAQ